MRAVLGASVFLFQACHFRPPSTLLYINGVFSSSLSNNSCKTQRDQNIMRKQGKYQLVFPELIYWRFAKAPRTATGC